MIIFHPPPLLENNFYSPLVLGYSLNLGEINYFYGEINEFWRKNIKKKNTKFVFWYPNFSSLLPNLSKTIIIILRKGRENFTQYSSVLIFLYIFVSRGWVTNLVSIVNSQSYISKFTLPNLLLQLKNKN